MCMLCLCCFLARQLQLVADKQEDFAVSISAHGIQWIVCAGFTLKDGEVGFEPVLQVCQHLLGLRVREESQKPPALLPCLFLL